VAPSSVLSVYYDKICIKFASHHFLLYVVYMCQKSLNIIYAFKCYQQNVSGFTLAGPPCIFCARVSRTKGHWTRCHRTKCHQQWNLFLFSSNVVFQFVALPFNMSQLMVISAYYKLCFAHATLITGMPRHEH